MKAQNKLAPKLEAKKKVSFSQAVNSTAMQNMMLNALKDKKIVSRLTATLISAVSQTPKLQECEPDTIVAAALRGEGMGLIYGHGYYIVPYGDKAAFSTGYKGYIQLAISTGFYADINALEIRKGELEGRDPRTGRWKVNLALYTSDEDREAQPIIGYYAYYELKDGTFRSEYWSLDKLLKHADRYSPAFSLENFQKLQAGEATPEETKKFLSGTPWYDEGEGQAKMCKKTVLRQLLNSGYAPLSNEVRAIFREDIRAEEPEAAIFDNIVREQEVVEALVGPGEMDAEAGEATQDAKTEEQDTGGQAEGNSAQEGGETPAEGDPVASFFDGAED